MPRIAALTVAPVKALAAVRRESVVLEADGVADDRRLFLLRADGTVATQRQLPTLTAAVPDLDLVAGSLRVTLPDGATATSRLRPAGDVLRATLFGKARAGREVPGDVADLLSAYVGEPLRLVLADAVGVGWDEGPVSVVGEASVSAVGAPACDGVPAARRFRMLVEVTGCAAFEEDSWVGHRVLMGEAVVDVTHRLGRCVVIDRSPSTGRTDWPGVRSLAARRGVDLVALGVVADVTVPGPVRVGDEVEPLERASSKVDPRGEPHAGAES